MKYQSIKISLFVLAISSALFLTSCRRDKDRTKDNDTEAASDQAMGENIYTDVLSIADEASTNNLNSFKTASACATITHDTLSTPKLLTIDFGSSNCLCNDGKYRRGKILVSYTGKYKDAGHVHNISFDGYHVNDNQVLGSKTVSNAGLNTSGQTYFTISVNGLIVKSSGDSIVWTSNRTRTWVAGEASPSRMDDVYHITGSGSGTRANGVSYTMNIIDPLVKEIGCKWFTQGKMELQPSGKALRTIDFGTGSCDNQAIVLIGGTTYNITLK